jgi:hypothetical protein
MNDVSPPEESLEGCRAIPLETITLPIPTDLMIRWAMEHGSMWDRFAMLRRVRKRCGYRAADDLWDKLLRR